MLGQVAIPSGAVYPDGLNITTPDPHVQASVRPAGSYFVKSVGYQSIRIGKTKLQDNHGLGIHFTPQRFAENVDQSQSLPLMVNATTAADHADIADLPGSANLTMDGNIPSADHARANRRVLAADTGAAAPTGDVRLTGRSSLPDMGDREPHRPLSQIFHGLSHPVELFKGEYSRDPLIAIGGAALITAVAWSIGRDFERSYRSRESSASSGGGVSGAAAPVAAAPAAAVDTAGNTVEKAAETAVEAVETVVEATGAVVETAAEAVETVTEGVADALTGEEA